MKIPDLLVILGLINVLSLILITGSNFQNYTIFFENNYNIVLKIPIIYAQHNEGIFDDGYIFPPFEESDNVEDRDDDDRSGSRSGSGGGSSIDDDDRGGGSGSGAEDGGNEEKINGTTNNFSPLSSRAPNTFNKANLDNKVNQTIGQQPEQNVEDAFQVRQKISQPINQTVGNEVNQTLEQQEISQQSELQEFE